MDLANPTNLLIAGQMPSIYDTVQKSAVDQQTLQQNQNALNQQARAEQARRALAVATDPNATPEARNAGMNALQQLDPASAGQLRSQMASKAALSDWHKNPTPQNTIRALTANPDLQKQIEAGWDLMDGQKRQTAISDLADVHGYLSSGDAKGALAKVDAHIESEKAAGIDTTPLEKLRTTIAAQPNAGLAATSLMLAVGMGTDKFAENYKAVGEEDRKRELQPSAVAKAQAEASKATTEAVFAPKAAQAEIDVKQGQIARWQAQTAGEADQRRLGWANLSLDKDKLETETSLKLQELQASAGKVPEGQLGAINQRITDSVTSSALADRAYSLAEQLKVSGARGGPGSGWAEAIKKAWGSQDAVSQLRSEYQQFVNGAALKMLPPGPASDKDVAFVKQGFPSETAPPEYMAKWLETYGRLQEKVAAASERQGGWMAANGGSLGPAKTDITVGGVTIRAGTPFTQFSKAQIGQEKNKSLPVGINALAERYAKK